jgi:hypothetical protein
MTEKWLDHDEVSSLPRIFALLPPSPSCGMIFTYGEIITSLIYIYIYIYMCVFFFSLVLCLLTTVRSRGVSRRRERHQLTPLSICSMFLLFLRCIDLSHYFFVRSLSLRFYSTLFPLPGFSLTSSWFMPI